MAGGQIELTVETYGRNLAYQWLRNGEILDGQTQPTLKFESFDPALHAGDYILETTNPFGTVSSDVISISEIIVQSLAIRASFPEQHDMLISFDVMEEVEVLFTAHGPSLETPNASEDPDIYLQDANENLIHRNDDWDLSSGTLESFGVYSLNDLESAILHVLAPGSYSVRARDLGDIAAEMEIQLHTLGMPLAMPFKIYAFMLTWDWKMELLNFKPHPLLLIILIAWILPLSRFWMIQFPLYYYLVAMISENFPWKWWKTNQLALL